MSMVKKFKFCPGWIIRYPEQLRRISNALMEMGTLNIDMKELDESYRLFSNDYFNCDWATVTEDIIYLFAIWLSKQKVN